MIPPTTMNLLPKIEISGEFSERKDNVSDLNVKSMDLFPPRAVFMPSVPMEAGNIRYGTEALVGMTEITRRIFETVHGYGFFDERSSFVGLALTRPALGWIWASI